MKGGARRGRRGSVREIRPDSAFAIPTPARRSPSMSSLAEIEEAIEKLPDEQLFQLTDWISERFSDAWDRQIEQDIVAGKLDALAAEAIAEHRAGQSLPLLADEGQGEPEVLEALQATAGAHSVVGRQAIQTLGQLSRTSFAARQESAELLVLPRHGFLSRARRSRW